jgi:hypothetical protein
MSPKDTSVIPYGYECYTFTGKTKKQFLYTFGQEIEFPETKRCPYWHAHPPNIPDGDAYCEYLDSIGEYDPEDCYAMLWDQLKECGVNVPSDEDCFFIPEEEEDV